MAITGIGGLFFRAQNPAALCDWYKTHLGIDVGGIWSQQAGMSLIVPFAQDSDYFPADKAFMLNFRVDALDPLLASLRAAGIAIITKPEWDTPETGRFARIHDPEGNPVELWEPPAD
jgi:predicted enzyme related to lactoylglutathione lyase